MSDLVRDALLSIKDQIRDAAGRFAADTITAAEFRAETDLLIQAIQALEAVATKSPVTDTKER